VAEPITLEIFSDYALVISIIGTLRVVYLAAYKQWDECADPASL
jgi:hypothetical protein